MNGYSKLNSNYVSDILDEIALEGLDGITLESLWLRLSVRQRFSFKIDEDSKRFLWNIINRMNDVLFYELPTPRAPLKYYDYLAGTDNENAILELDELYPYCSVKNVPGIFGSCQHYFTRTDITNEVIEMNLKDVEEKWGDKLVIVASQETRHFALCGSFCTPKIDFSKCPIQFDILEKIGRSRHLGMATFGKGSIQSVVEDPKSVFHYFKALQQNKLIKKQYIIGNLMANSNAAKVYLTRFFGEGSVENMSILQMAIEELKARPPHYMMPLEDFYALFDAKKKEKIKKYKKNALFKKYITITKNLPYRQVFPNASQAEWERKSKNGERVVRCFQLINPDVELNETTEKDNDVEDEDTILGFIPRGIYYRNMPIVAQAYHHIKSSGAAGITQLELNTIMGLNKRFTRVLIKRLVSEKLCKYFIESDGRKRSKRYIVGENMQAKAAASEIAQILSETKTTTPSSNVTKSDSKEEKEDSEPKTSPEKISLPQLQDENMSYRGLKRMGLIIKFIKTHQFKMLHQIIRHVNEEEAKEGITSKVDKNTILRILLKLEKDGIVKTIRLTGDREDDHVVRLFADPSFEPDKKLADTLYHTHLSYKIPDFNRGIEESDGDLDKELSVALMDNLMEMKKMLSGVRSIESRNIGNFKEHELSYAPKFVRLNILHDLLIHLVYDYTGITDKSQEELMEELSKTTSIDEKLKNEMPQLYSNVCTTYMFVPPLKYSGKMPGWLLISDLLIRMPFSVIIKLLRVSENSPDFCQYLHHPVRKHFLIKDLPFSMREALFLRKHQWASFYGDLRRLCYMGLLQYGLKLGREHYQTSLYVNRRASLLDTTKSPPSYYYVSSDIQYDVKSYYFNNKEDIKKYWLDMFNICMATNMGIKSNAVGKEILNEREFCKEILKKVAEPKSVANVHKDDDGRIPGDKLGAAGLDSVMFSFLRNNWTGPVNKSKEIIRKRKIVTVPVQNLKKDQIKRGKSIMKRSRRRKIGSKSSENPEKVDLKLKESSTTEKKKKTKEKESVSRVRRNTSSYDEIDLEALKLMNSLRVTWSMAEDNLLLLCRVAMMYLCPNFRTFVRIPWIEIRKILQEYLPESKNKTQKAIARRIVNMLKNPTTVRSVNLFLEEVKQMPEVKEKFDCSELLVRIKPSAENLTELQEQLYVKFHELVAFLRDKINLRRNTGDLIPDTLEEFLDKFETETPSSEEPFNTKVIRENVIRTILVANNKSQRNEKLLTNLSNFWISYILWIRWIFCIYLGSTAPNTNMAAVHLLVNRGFTYYISTSSLSCRADKTSTAIQLFEIYRHYEEDELQTAIKGLHMDKVITMTKKNPNPLFKSGQIMPLTFSPYKLSFAFQTMLTTRLTHCIYPESFSRLNQMLEKDSDEEFEVDLNDCNLPLFLLASKELLVFKAVPPEQIIAFDSEDLPDDTYSKMLERYFETLRFSNSDSKVICSGKIISRTEEGEVLNGEGGKKRKLSDAGTVSTKKSKVKEKKEKEEKKGKEDGKEEKEMSESEKIRENDDKQERFLAERDQLLNDKSTRSSRVILFIMREQAKNLSKNDLESVSQESCVVNASRVFTTVQRDGLEQYMKAMDSKIVNKAIKSIVGRSLVPVNLVDEESVIQKLKDDEVINAGRKVLEIIQSKTELGATAENLKGSCESNMLGDIMRHLKESKVIIKTGINETRYISQKYATPWVLNSFKLTRLEREKMKPTEMTGVALSGSGEGEAPLKKLKKVIPSENLKSQEHVPPACSTDAGNKIKIIIRPWIRIDGSLNRKVLDRFLGVILSHIMTNPGVNLRSVMDKFSPTLTPIWTKELVEILNEIGCIVITVLVVTREATLFSSSRVEISSNYTGLEDDNCVLLDAKVDAITILGLFIGKKNYSRDFLVD